MICLNIVLLWMFKATQIAVYAQTQVHNFDNSNKTVLFTKVITFLIFVKKLELYKVEHLLVM